MTVPKDEQIGRPPGSAVLLVLAGVVAIVVALSLGRGGDWYESVLLLPQIGRWAAPGFAYLAAGIGYGLLLRPLVRGCADEAAMVVGLGIVAVATASEIAGCLGLLASRAGAIAVLGPGWAAVLVFLWGRRKGRVEIASPSVLGWLAIVPVAVLVAAASAPPGWLWDSEYGGFDVLSYHLELPQEWLAAGRIRPFEHNVYSFLPGFYEAGVYHLAAMTGASRPVAGGAASGGFGMLADGGWRLISGQYLHVWFTVIAAWMIGRAARAAVRLGSADAGSGAPDPTEREAGRMATVVALATPWCVVVGSLAYNEMAVVGLGAAALAAAMDQRLKAWRRGLAAGLLIGGACGFKPTAMTFLAPGVGLILLATSKPREWAGLVAAGAAAGAAMLMPWMVRNWLAGGNPVFPFASGVFGSAHWTAEQIARYSGGHSFHGGLGERLGMLVLADPAVGVDGRDVERWRGMLNPQYGLLFPAVVGALIGVVAVRARMRRAALLAGAMFGLGLLAWLFTTHLQARFLLPLVVPGCVLVGLGLAGGGRDQRAPSTLGVLAQQAYQGVVSRVIAIGLVAWQCNVLAVTFLNQHGGAPNGATLVGPALFTGELAQEPGATPAGYVGRVLPEGSRVYLLGDAAPLYMTARLPPKGKGGGVALVWNTTWDSSALGDAIRMGGESEAGGGPSDWTAALRGRGVTHVLVNFAELFRYQRAGWYDPAVTPERVSVWVRTLGEPLAAWDATGQALFALPRAGGGGGPADE